MTKNKIHLYWLHSHFLYWMGGTKYVFEVVRRLNKEYKLTVIVENASDLAHTNYQRAGIELISLKKISSTSFLYWLTFTYQIWDTLRRIQKIVGKDHGQKIVVSSMFPMNFISSKLSAPHVQLCFEPFAFFHDPSFVQGFSPFKRLLIKVLSTLYAWVDLTSTRSASHIVTLNQVTEKVIKEVYGRESTPIYTGIDTNHFKPYVSDSLAKKYAPYKVIVHSTDYTPVKGTDKMLLLFAQVLKKEPTAKLLITSTIPSSSAKIALQNLAESLGISHAVEFLGFVDYDLLPQLYSMARVLVQCSFSERSGTTSMALPVKEALACGTPCIRAPITTEDVVDGVTGYLVDPRNDNSMLEHILLSLNISSTARAKCRTLARSSIVKRYSWEHTVASLTSIINKYVHD